MNKIKEILIETKEDITNQVDNIKNSGGKLLPLLVGFWVSLIFHLIFWNRITFLIFFIFSFFLMGIAQVTTNIDVYSNKFSILKNAMEKKK